MTGIDQLSVISSDDTYRYLLLREISQPGLFARNRGTLNAIMLNPSKAKVLNPTRDKKNDDNTVAKLMGFCERLGFGRLLVTNLYALRSTDPTELLRHRAPVGPGNDAAISNCAKAADMIVAAWGSGPSPALKIDVRARAVLELVNRPVYCLARTEDGRYPRHPLYLPYSSEPTLFYEPPNQEGSPP